MITENITITGKEVTLAYCYATEIAYKELSGQDIDVFIKQALQDINTEPKRMPDVRSTIYLILAAAMAYYNAIEEECPIKDTDLINDATPVEIGKTLGTVLNLWAQFYYVPAEDKPKKKAKGKSKKN